MISKELLSILVCPENRTPLELADAALLDLLNQAITAGRIQNKAGETVYSTLDAALVRHDRTVAYPIVDRIPILLVDAGIALQQLKLQGAAAIPIASHLAASVTTVAITVSQTSLWTSEQAPAVADCGDSRPVELGVRFTSLTEGSVAGVRFYKSLANTGTHTGSLWSADGSLLARGTFTHETPSGWQTLTFAQPVPMAVGSTYVASYHSNTGHFSVDRDAFTTGYSTGLLRVPVDGGVFSDGESAFPTQTYQSSNFWVDVMFDVTLPADAALSALADTSTTSDVAHADATSTVRIVDGGAATDF